MYISNIQEIKRDLRIEDIVREYQPEYKERQVCCPFHAEKTPSFSVSKEKNIATCFGGCGTFDPIAYIRKQDNCTFIEAVEKAAKICKVEIKYHKAAPEVVAKYKEKQEKTIALTELNRLVASAYFAKAYGENVPETVNFETSGIVRKLSRQTVEKFGVCLTPEDWDFIQKQGYDANTLAELGVIRTAKNGKLYDAFRNRLLFPLQGRSNSIVGFAGRALTKEEKIKYTNSPESAIYKKKQFLYGLYPQLNYLQKTKFAFISEGYFDVLTPYDGGFDGIVATCGTALTEQHAKLLKRYVNRVCFLADNDSDKEKNAGLEAVRRALPILLKEGLGVELVVLPDNQDPDSYFREVGLQAFENYIDSNRQDALLWQVENAWFDSMQDPFAVAEIVEMALGLVALCQNENMIDTYCNKICKLIGVKVLTFKMQLRGLQNDKLGGGGNEYELDLEQQKSVNRYGLYEASNAIYCVKANGGGYSKVSNFIVKPLFHLSSKENPKRLFEIVNEVGQSRIVETETANLVSLDKFKNVVESQGNFVFYGNAIQYNRLKSKIYDMMATCYEIETLGYHKDGFYAFGNGIYTLDNKFIETDKYGVLECGKKQYFLPAFSDIYKGEDSLLDEEKNFVYAPSKVDFAEWAKLFCEVHGKEGQISLLFYIAALYRSHIQKYVKMPLLNLFGQPSTGKSMLAENLICMFTKKPKGFNIHSGTKVGLYNKLVVAKDALILFEEYKNAIAPNKVEALKSIYDNVGRERGQKSASKNMTTKVHSTALLVGQELPTADVALFTRCITLAFSKMDYTQEEKNRAEVLKSLRGKLSGITAELTTLRPKIEAEFLEKYKEQFSELRNHVATESIPSRMIENNAILLAVYEVFKNTLKFPFDGVDIFTACADNLFKQHGQISKENEVSVFWSLVEFLASSRLISENEDYMVKYGVKAPNSGKRLLYLNFGKVYALYMEHHRKQYNKAGLSKSSLQHYLKSHHTYLDSKNSCRFGTRVTSAFVFDYEKVGISIIAEPEATTDTEEGVDVDWNELEKGSK